MDDLDLAREERDALKGIPLLQKLNERQEGPVDQLNVVLIAMPYTVY